MTQDPRSWRLLEFRPDPLSEWVPVCSHIRDIDETHQALIQLWGIYTEMRIWIESIDGDKARVSINADHELIEEVLDGQS